MKKILLILCLFPILVFSQKSYKIPADSTILNNIGSGKNELVIRNATSNITGGVLTNLGNGVTAFVLGGGSARVVDTIYKNTSKDSIVFTILGVRYAVKDSSGGVSDSIYLKRTIAQLRTAMAAKTLEKGALYEATDFTTIYDQPDFDNIGDPKDSVTTKTASIEPLVFTAITDSSFDNYVSSTKYPNDVLKFDWSFDSTEIMNAPAKGRITYREDDKGNICEYDFRTVLFKRYRNAGIYSEYMDNDSVSAEFLTFNDYEKTVGTTMTGYVPIYYADYLPFPFVLPNVVFRDNCFKNKFDIVFNCTFLGETNENFIGDGGVGITAYAGFFYNYFGHGAENLTFLGNAENNYFGDETLNCLFGPRCNDNSIWDKLTNFTAGEDFKRNIQYGDWSNSTVGDAFTDGVIYGLTDSITCGDNNFKVEFKSALAITIGDNNSNISFGGTKHIMPLNDFNGVKNVAFGGSIDGYNWINGINTTDHPEFYNATTKTIISGSNGSVYARYFNGLTDAITIIN